MDPVTAISLGANILQFADFTIRLISTGNEIRDSLQGTTVENEDLEAVTHTIIHLNEQITQSKKALDNGAPMSAADRIVADLARECDKIANELLVALHKLKNQDKRTRWTSVVQALKTVWAKGDIESFCDRLEQRRAAMQSAMLISLRNKVDGITPSLLQVLAKGSAVEKIKAEILQAIRDTQMQQSAQNSSNSWQDPTPSELVLFSAQVWRMNRQEKLSYLEYQIQHKLNDQDYDEREYRIKEAHSNTFQWIFKTPPEDRERRWSDFVSWLERDDEHLYWITGKAGSGKSTLMKYIIQHDQCKESLRVWAGDLPLIVTGFYFWNSGALHQMSQEGLLRSILSDAIHQIPDLIPHVFPQPWNRYESFGFGMQPGWFTKLPNLMHAFDKLIASTSEHPFKICLFVDGLDEFRGEHGDMIALLRQAVSAPNVKACVSSRPWIVFEEAFLQGPNLRLENLTHTDIVQYVTANFNNSPGFQRLERFETSFAFTLIQNIAGKSCGVFLWVYLVTKSLLSGMSNYDSTLDLQRRLDEYPSDLEDFYQKMFDSIDPFYKEQAYRYFLLVQSKKRSSLTALGLSFADEEEPALIVRATQAQVAPLDEEEKQYRYENVTRRLNSRCKGMIEVPATDIENAPPPHLHQVTYIHRTAKDFLESYRIDSQIRQYIPNFRSSVHLFSSSILTLKAYDWNKWHSRSFLEDLFRATLDYASSIIDFADQYQSALDQLPGIMDHLHESPGKHAWIQEVFRQPHHTNYLHIVARYPLHSYVLERLRCKATIFSDVNNWEILRDAIVFFDTCQSFQDPHLSSAAILAPSMSIVRHILEMGTSPNSAVGGRSTLWQTLLRKCDSERGRLDAVARDDKYSIIPLLQHWATIVELFIKAGADPNENFRHAEGSFLRTAFGTYLDDRVDYLEQLLQQNARKQVASEAAPKKRISWRRRLFNRRSKVVA